MSTSRIITPDGRHFLWHKHETPSKGDLIFHGETGDVVPADGGEELCDIFVPAPPIGIVQAQPNGLTKREHFAGLAMQGMAADLDDFRSMDDFAAVAVRAADALLLALASIPAPGADQ